VLAGYSPEDPKTVAAIDKIPEGGYSSKLSKDALKGARLGLYGPGWRNNNPLSDECGALYARAVNELKSLGAVVVEDPFAGSGFASLANQDVEFDDRGLESIAYDMELFLRRLGPSKATYPATTVSEINIAGLPGVTVPAGRFSGGSPFSLIFVGPMWSEAELLGLAFALRAGNASPRCPSTRQDAVRGGNPGKLD
jgi:Asp-tRNA(Asn)/Glu-tRNA(Gln) amidotransferase A subunit family amidase